VRGTNLLAEDSRYLRSAFVSKKQGKEKKMKIIGTNNFFSSKNEKY
jgi:hypothetical protein